MSKNNSANVRKIVCSNDFHRVLKQVQNPMIFSVTYTCSEHYMLLRQNCTVLISLYDTMALINHI